MRFRNKICDSDAMLACVCQPTEAARLFGNRRSPNFLDMAPKPRALLPTRSPKQPKSPVKVITREPTKNLESKTFIQPIKQSDISKKTNYIKQTQPEITKKSDILSDNTKRHVSPKKFIVSADQKIKTSKSKDRKREDEKNARKNHKHEGVKSSKENLTVKVMFYVCCCGLTLFYIFDP